jgi:hypothetical protein
MYIVRVVDTDDKHPCKSFEALEAAKAYGEQARAESVVMIYEWKGDMRSGVGAVMSGAVPVVAYLARRGPWKVETSKVIFRPGNKTETRTAQLVKKMTMIARRYASYP